jgi:CBS domain-containing protein
MVMTTPEFASRTRFVDLYSTTAADLDSRRVVTCTPDARVQAAAVLMMEHYARYLLVQDHTGPVGIVFARDLLGAYAI